MARRSDDEDLYERLRSYLGAYPPGMHRLSKPARLFDSALPEVLVRFYRHFDGLELFYETVTITEATRLRGETLEGVGRCYRIGEIEGDDLYVDEGGQVMRAENETGELLREGSRFDRWILGAAEAEGLLYGDDGEFRDDLFDDEGDLTPEMRERMCRRLLKRDRQAVAPRWRLARALSQQGKLDEARRELEEVVSAAPDFPWAWFDLAQISESLGQTQLALDEMRAAAEAQPAYEHRGLFWAHAARLCALAGDEVGRAACAAEALACDPDLARSQRSGAEATLEDGDADAARSLVDLALALSPRDLEALELKRRILQAQAEPQGDSVA